MSIFQRPKNFNDGPTSPRPPAPRAQGMSIENLLMSYTKTVAQEAPADGARSVFDILAGIGKASAAPALPILRARRVLHAPGGFDAACKIVDRISEAMGPYQKHITVEESWLVKHDHFVLVDGTGEICGHIGPNKDEETGL